jgi:hypothetical protein
LILVLVASPRHNLDAVSPLLSTLRRHRCEADKVVNADSFRDRLKR